MDTYQSELTWHVPFPPIIGPNAQNEVSWSKNLYFENREYFSFINDSHSSSSSVFNSTVCKISALTVSRYKLGAIWPQPATSTLSPGLLLLSGRRAFAILSLNFNGVFSLINAMSWCLLQNIFQTN